MEVAPSARKEPDPACTDTPTYRPPHTEPVRGRSSGAADKGKPASQDLRRTGFLCVRAATTRRCVSGTHLKDGIGLAGTLLALDAETVRFEP